MDFRTELQKIADECSEADWDCYGALPIFKSSIKNTMAVIDNLPENIIPPDITPDSDGCFNLDWDLGKYDMFSIQVDGVVLLWSGIVKRKSISGISMFLGNVLPPSITEILTDNFYKGAKYGLE